MQIERENKFVPATHGGRWVEGIMSTSGTFYDTLDFHRIEEKQKKVVYQCCPEKRTQ